MTLEEVIKLLNASPQIALTPLQELVLRSCWEGKTYTNMAGTIHYRPSHLRKVASGVWSLLSHFFGEPITKHNLRSTLEPRPLTLEQQQLIEKFTHQDGATSIEYPSGPVPLNSKFYISRFPSEQLAYAEITKPGCFIHIKAPSKTGKSSLMLRIIDRAVCLGYCIVSLDFQQADEIIFSSLDKFLRWFCANLNWQLQLQPMLDDYWDDDLGSKMSCTIYLQNYVLSQIDVPLVLAFNEVNKIFDYPKLASEFLSLLNSWHEEARRNETLQKLRFVVVYSTEFSIQLDLNSSPFNIGLVIQLPEFNLEQIQDLAQRHGLDWTDAVGIQNSLSLQAMVGGHPYLVRLALYHLVNNPQTNLEQLLQAAPTINGIYRTYLHQHLAVLQKNLELAKALKQVIIAGSLKLNHILASKLESLGLVKFQGNKCSVSCELYRKYFADQNFEEKNKQEQMLTAAEVMSQTLLTEDASNQTSKEFTSLLETSNHKAKIQSSFMKMTEKKAVRQEISYRLTACDCVRIANHLALSAALQTGIVKIRGEALSRWLVQTTGIKIALARKLERGDEEGLRILIEDLNAIARELHIVQCWNENKPILNDSRKYTSFEDYLIDLHRDNEYDPIHHLQEKF
jgi:AAA-like domain